MTLKVTVRKQVPGFDLDVAWEIGEEIGVIFGFSGAGKSLTLQLVTGLLTPDAGFIQANGTVLFDAAAGVNLSPQQRRIGYVFQDSLLFPHMNIAENIQFGFRGPRPPEADQLLRDIAERFEISDILGKYPAQISGGQKQRVAFARALIGAPLALLLDEPFSALDNPIRAKMRRFLKHIHHQFRIPIILVTHDVFEAYSIADRIIVYSGGRVVQTGRPEDVFGSKEHPQVSKLLDVEEFCRCGLLKARGTPPDSAS